MLNTNIPLAERMRPTCLDDYLGQEHLVGQGGIIRNMIESGRLSSFILWGPPGVGKTTLAQIIAHSLDLPFHTLSAVSSGVKDVREIIDKCRKSNLFNTNKAVLFIDEIHRFSKSQQDALLGAVEDGTFTLIGATTENPSFEVITPLLSRAQVYVLKELSAENLKSLAVSALTKDEYLKQFNIVIKDYELLLRFSGGDARKLLNIIDLIVASTPSHKLPLKSDTEGTALEITNTLVESILQKNIATYDKNGEQHYDIISAFIKSMRGSDPNGAVYWLARMIDGGEDPLFIARRMVILASEDIGLANPNALLLANACFQTVQNIGMPEGRIPLSETAIYLATSPKSNSAYMAIDKALSAVRKQGAQPVPLHLRNAPTKLMEELGYAKDYKYAHAFEGNFVDQEFLPEKLKCTRFYEPGNNVKEKQIEQRLQQLWPKYKY
ncbi:MAG: replication-associated recombination protein A [Bacteroidales bacterium]|nr:replication-associated recombination protein A [Candidatus Egerieousia equi]